MVVGIYIYHEVKDNSQIEETSALRANGNTVIVADKTFYIEYLMPIHNNYFVGGTCESSGKPIFYPITPPSPVSFFDVRIYKGGQQIMNERRTIAVSSTRFMFCGYCGKDFTGYNIFVQSATFKDPNISISGYGYGIYKAEYYHMYGSLLYTSTLSHHYTGTLNLNKNGGTGGTSAVSISSNSLSSVSVPTRNGHIFKGYYTGTNGGTQMFDSNGLPKYSPINFPSSLTSSSITLYANWTIINKSVTIEPGIGSYTGGNIGQAKSYYGDFGTCMQLYDPDPPAPSAAYDFTGWTTNYGGDGGGISLLPKERVFNGTASSVISLGRDRMYADSFTVSVWVYMDDWSSLPTGDYMFVSSTEGGGWCLYRESNGKFLLEIYEQNYGYVNVYSTTLAVNLTSGWHMITGVFNGQRSYMYIDSVLEATSDRTFVNGIQYHASNGMFIGAEAGPSDTVPLGGYFKGKMKGVGIFNAPMTSSTIKFLYDNKLSSYYCFGSTHGSIKANYQYYEPTISIDPNGGAYNGSTSATTSKKPRGTTMTLNVPTREGYTFKGWAQTNVSEKAAMSNLGNLDKSHTDPFLRGVSMYYIYNNSNNGNVTHARITKPADLSSTYNTHVLKISNIGTASPSLGGYVRHVASYANAEFYTVIQAKIPTGYRIEWASNATGDGRINKWLTPTQGTGEWETYVYYLKCGSTGSFISTNFFYLIANSGYPSYGTTTQPIDWYVASSAAYDATGMGLNPDTYVSNMQKATTYKFGNANQTLVALWEPDTWEQYATTPQIDNVDGFYKITNASELAWFAEKCKLGEISGYKLKLMNDIDLAGHYWYPIGNKGNLYGFMDGAFDGRGYSIKNLKVDASLQTCIMYAGLFGLVERSPIQNIKIESGYVKGGNFPAAGLVAWSWRNTFANCENRIDVSGGTSTGGIVGNAFSTGIEDCTNYGKISNGNDAGGIAGLMKTDDDNKYIKNSSNYGEISGNNHAGGIAGLHENELILINCINTGSVIGGTYAGGIIGNGQAVSMTKCYNSGEVTCAYYGAGLIGIAQRSLNLQNCGVNANIMGRFFSASGFVASATAADDKITINNCYFVGALSAQNIGINSGFGGISSSALSRISNSYTHFTPGGDIIKRYTQGNFADFSYVNGINEGYPVPSGLFWIGGVSGQNIVSYFQKNGFTLVA